MQEWNILGGTLLDFQDVPLESKSGLVENFDLALPLSSLLLSKVRTAVPFLAQPLPPSNHLQSLEPHSKALPPVTPRDRPQGPQVQSTPPKLGAPEPGEEHQV